MFVIVVSSNRFKKSVIHISSDTLLLIAVSNIDISYSAIRGIFLDNLSTYVRF